MSNWCKNYNGFHQNKRCDVGIEYITLQSRVDSPCLSQLSNTSCEKAIYPTPEEIEAENREVARYFKIYAQARQLITAQSGNAGTIECPKCSNSLSWTRASNGHVHGQCKTEKCLAWME
jgi:hypothetical protein